MSPERHDRIEKVRDTYKPAHEADLEVYLSAVFSRVPAHSRGEVTAVISGVSIIAGYCVPGVSWDQAEDPPDLPFLHLPGGSSFGEKH